MSRKYNLGTEVELCGEFRNADGSFVNPTSVSCEVTDPNEAPTIYTFPETITNGSVGRYYLRLTPTTGVWGYRWVSTGAGQGSDSGKFEVRA